MDMTTSGIATTSKIWRVGDWVLRCLLAAAFAAAGLAKLMSAEPMVALFEQIGAGQWLRIVVALIEIAGAILVLFPRTAVAGAALLAATMAGATIFHLALIGGNPLPAIALLLMACAVLWLRRADIGRIRL